MLMASSSKTGWQYAYVAINFYPRQAICYSALKVHKHEIFFLLFLQKPKPYGAKGL